MLNFTAYRLLADPERVAPVAARFFLRLICDLDLTRFKAIKTRNLMDSYGLNPFAATKALADLVAIGLLEPGPLSTKPVRQNTYRINPAYLLTREELEQHFSETRNRRERESLIPLDSK